MEMDAQPWGGKRREGGLSREEWQELQFILHLHGFDEHCSNQPLRPVWRHLSKINRQKAGMLKGGRALKGQSEVLSLCLDLATYYLCVLE